MAPINTSLQLGEAPVLTGLLQIPMLQQTAYFHRKEQGSSGLIALILYTYNRKRRSKHKKKNGAKSKC